MYRRCAVKFHKKQVEFINCVNMVERIKKARALPAGTQYIGIERYVLTSRRKGNNMVFSKRAP